MKRRWDCPCGNFTVVATRRASDDLVDLMLGEHLKVCVVAQAELITRAAVVDDQGDVE